MAIILIVKNDHGNQELRLGQGPIVIGRSSSCGFKLDDPKVSSRHVAIKVGAAGKTIVKDLGSTNGTFLNGVKITESFLQIDQELIVGSHHLFLDESQMTPSEKRNHQNTNEQTKLTYVDMNFSEEVKEAQLPTSSETIQSAEVQEEAEEENILFEEDDHVSDNAADRLKKRLLKKSKDVSASEKSVNLQFSGKEEVFELESTGHTSMIKLDRKKLIQKETAAKKKEKINNRRPDPKKESGSVFSKIKKALGGKDD